MRILYRLSARSVAAATKVGRHADGGGLYLVVDRSGAKRWCFIYRWKDEADRPGPGRLREMGLGSVNSVPLSRARERAAEARALLAEKVDPITARRAPVGSASFGEIAEEVIAVRAAQSRSGTSMARWRRALAVHAAPLTLKRVDSVSTADVLEALRPIWLKTPEMAQKTRGYIEAVLDAAKAKGLRHGENPARWKGHLDQLLPKPKKLTRGHHAAMAFEEVPKFVRELRASDAVAARALEFTILSAARTGEVIGATWEEVDLQNQTWTIAANRMKSGREHRVPLSGAALMLLAAMRDMRVSDFIFPSERDGRGLSEAAMSALLKRIGQGDVTVHGFRSAFRDWAGECTSVPREVAEAALAHATGSQTERAYRRGDAFGHRRELMEAWATYLEAGQPSAQLSTHSCWYPRPSG